MSNPFSLEAQTEINDLFKPRNGDFCFMVNNRWPKWGWCPRKIYYCSRWWPWFPGKFYLVTSSDPAITQAAINITEFVDQDGNLVDFTSTNNES